MERSKPVAITRTRLIALIAIMRIRLIATAKEEAIAAIQEDYIITGDGQEGEGRKNEGYAFSGNVGEVVRLDGEALAAEATVEEAGEGLG